MVGLSLESLVWSYLVVLATVLETTFVHTPSAGSGNGNKQRHGREAVEKLLARKQSVVTIKN